MSHPTISVRKISKKYRLGLVGMTTLRDELQRRWARLRGDQTALGVPPKTQTPEGGNEFWALRDVSFDVQQGDVVGLIGRNGAGKSTLLKILSRITEPTLGEIRLRGRVASLLEVGTGFHPELSGYENIYLNGAVLGMSRAEIRKKFDEIVEFSEIGKFINTPVKRYSSGMYVRLAFAVAAHLEPEILIIDEVLAVGDVAFQRKCMNFARELQRKNATILFVSHNMFSIKTMCQRVIYLRKGKIEYDGPTDAGIEMYERGSELAVVPWSKDDPAAWPIILTDIDLYDDSGATKSVFDFGERMTMRIRYNAREAIPSPNVMVALMRSDGIGCSVYANDVDGVDLGTLDGEGTLELSLPPIALTSERYVIHILVRQRDTQRILCAQVGRSFHVRHELLDAMNYGVFHEAAQWKVETGSGAEAKRAKA